MAKLKAKSMPEEINMEKFQMKFVSTQIKVLLFLSFMGILFASSNLYSIYHGTKCEEQFDRVLTKYYTINQFMTLFSENPVENKSQTGDIQQIKPSKIGSIL